MPRILNWLVVLVTFALASEVRTTETVTAGESPDASVAYRDRLQQLEAEVSAIRSYLDEVHDSSYESCITCPPSDPWVSYASFAFVFVRPYFSAAANYREEAISGARRFTSRTFRFEPFHNDYQLTPRFWCGVVGPRGLGLRWRYWQYDHQGEVTAVTTTDNNSAWIAVAEGPPSETYQTNLGWQPNLIFNFRGTALGDTLVTSNGLELHVSDLEATRHIRFFCDSVTVSVGIRLARIEQDYAATLFDEFDVEKQFMALKHEFAGVGPTLAVDIGQSLGFWGLELVASGRGSVLFGHLDSSAEGNQPGSYEMVDAQHAVGSCEAEIGVQWKHETQHGVSVFLRGGYEGQIWLGTGSPNAIDGDLMFEGFSVASGLTY